MAMTSPLRLYFCSTLRIPCASGWVKPFALASLLRVWMHDLLSPAGHWLKSLFETFKPNAQLTSLSPENFQCPTVFIHILKSFGSQVACCQAPSVQPVVDSRHGRIACKTFLSQQFCGG